MSKNLITGGFGFLGRSLVQRLVEMGEEVVVFDLAGDPTGSLKPKDGVTRVRGDIIHLSHLLDTAQKNRVDRIYHTAALLPPVSEENLNAAFAVNVGGTVNVLEAARILGLKQVIFISSIATYGPGLPRLVNEDRPQHPLNMYGVTKVCGERLGEQYHRTYGLDFRALRFPPILGPGRRDSAPSAFSYLAIREPALGRPYTVYVKAETRLPLLYLKDAVQGLISLKDAGENRLGRRIYNIGGLFPSAGELVSQVRKHIPEARIDYQPHANSMKIIESWPLLDDTRAREEWGWRPGYSLEKSIEDFISEVRAAPGLYV